MVNMPFILAEEEPGFWASVLQAFFHWMLNAFCMLIKPLVEYALEQIPNTWIVSLGEQIVALSYWYGILDHWVPLDWLINAALVFVAWRIGFIVALILVKILRGA